VLIGNNATVLVDVEIGDFCAIAAGSVVTEGMKVPSGAFVAGVPGEIKGELTENQRRWLDMHFKYYSELKKKYKKEGL
jgi:carbonic anhydrase/acetyltransferase-like protein (isoleucine patch superfamily)